jgi:Methylamine utilisation protein MauE
MTETGAEMSCHKPSTEEASLIRDYWPLIALTSVAALAGLAIASGFGSLTMTTFMHGFMGVFLIIFALLKLFDIPGFQSGFAMYDLLASRVPAYGAIYPFLELALGLAYLAFIAPTATYVATIVLFLFGTLGVVTALRNGLNISCPCMGNILKVPLSTVTLTEDLAMVGMAALLLIG